MTDVFYEDGPVEWGENEPTPHKEAWRHQRVDVPTHLIMRRIATVQEALARIEARLGSDSTDNITPFSRKI